MAPRLNPNYIKMLDAPAPPVDGPRKDLIGALQKQIDFYIGEVNRLRYSQNLHVAISRLPSELLAEAFLCLVASSLQDDDTRFAAGTFNFLQVCRRWNEVAVGCPQLWGWWVAGAARAWPLFSSRSKDVPIFLTWRPHLDTPARDILIDPAIPKRINQLDFSGTSGQLEHFLGAFDSTPPSNASSIRLRIISHSDSEPRKRLSRFLSSSFPNLSQLVLGNFPAASVFPVFTTSSLTSLKLFLSYGRKQYTLSQFSHILRRHPGLRELELNHSAIPLPGPPGDSQIPVTLPRLINLKLYGMDTAILGFLDFIGMSSPLHEVTVRFSTPRSPTVVSLGTAVQQILAAYYGCHEPAHPRKINRLAISYDPDKCHLSFNTRYHSTPSPIPKYRLKLQFNGVNVPNEAVKEALPLFPLNHVHGLTLEGSLFYEEESRWMFWEIEHLSHLRLDDVDLWSALNALCSGDPEESHGQIFPKLESLTLSHADVLFGCEGRLIDFLGERSSLFDPLKKLVLQSCLVHDLDYRSRLEEQVDKVKWDNVKVPDSECGDSNSNPYESESEGGSDDGGIGAYREISW